MFDISANTTSDNDNSELKKRESVEAMNFVKSNLTNSPALLTGMSHEMRTHMNAIVAFSYLMKENCGHSAENDEFSRQILCSCEQLISLFDSYFDSAIIDTGNSKTDSKVCKIDTMLNDLFSEFRESVKKDGQKEVELISELQFSGSAEVLIDSGSIFRAIRSLFQNAIKNTNSGYIKVGFSLHDDKLIFYVLDSGQGYFKSKEFLLSEDINESLIKYNDTYTAINIILAKKLIQTLGGTIWIEYNGLTGSGIYFSVPARIIVKSDVNINKYINTMIAI